MSRTKYFYAAYAFSKCGFESGFGSVTFTVKSKDGSKPELQLKEATNTIKERNNFDSVVIISWQEISKAQMQEYEILT